ncbi:hypothetical protein Q9L58_001565 [Maublancomyces gigas]|uniref:Uncharacterized protein n=1 Tax=Discina gigas TaxID=1032678 RepID=A0ABR3GTT6_9PEZI
MIQPAHARNWDSTELPQASCADADPSAFGDHDLKLQKRKPGRKPGCPKRGSCKEHPIEVEVKRNYRKASVGGGKKSGGSKHSFPASTAATAAAPQYGEILGESFQVQKSRNVNPRLSRSSRGGGDRLPQHSQAAMETTGAYYPQSQMSSQLLGAVQLGQIPPMKPPAAFRPFLISGDSPVATAQQCLNNISLGANARFQRGAQYAPNNLGGAVSGPSRFHTNSYFQATPDTTNDHYPSFELGTNSHELPSAGMNSDGWEAPPSGADWLVDSEEEQKIVDGWLEDWESGGLLSDTIEGPLFRN